jgi:hypothetical protein
MAEKDAAGSGAAGAGSIQGGRPGRPVRVALYAAAAVCAIVLALFVADAIIFGHGRSYAARRAREEAAWWSTLWDEVAVESNRYYAYHTLAASLPKPPSALWRHTCTRLSRPPGFGDTWPADDEPLRRDIREHEAALEELMSAAGRPGYRMPERALGRAGEGLSTAGRHTSSLLPLHLLGKLLAWQGWAAILEGRRTEGLCRLGAVARLGSDMAAGTTSDLYHTGVMLHSDVAMVIADTLSLPEWRPEELREFARVLEEAALPPVWQCVRVELLTALAHVAAGECAFLARFPQETHSTPGRTRMLWSRLEALSVEGFDRRMLAAISALRRHDGTARAHLGGVLDELLGMDRDRVANWMSATTIPSVFGSEPLAVMLELTVVALRVRAMHLAHGRFPQSLADLEQCDGLAVPTGAFGEPFKVIRAGAGGVIVYDTGRDRQDDSGRNEEVAVRRAFPPTLRDRPNPRSRKEQDEVRRSLETGDDAAIMIGVRRTD